MEFLQIAVASDLHAFDDPQGKEDPSYLSLDLPDNEPGKHPITGLLHLVRRENLQAHLLLCAGDIGDKARPAAIKYAWASLDRIRASLGAERLAVTTGNHDYDSRHIYNSYDAKGVLQALDPPYPLPDEGDNDRYWARNFVLVEADSYRLLILNSSAYHGGGHEELEHGRVSDATLERLKRALASTLSKPVNILLCHHHPKPHTELQLGEGDIMANGQQLLDLLASGEFGSWIVVHGHKHHPKLSYADGGGSTPVVFAAGSLCAILKPPLSNAVRNQFYLIRVPLDLIDEYGLVGTVRSWEWVPGRGWSGSAPKSQLPPYCGFGYRTNPVLLARKIAALVTTDRMKWALVRSNIPEVDYLIPQDMDVVRRSLETKYQLGLVEDRDGTILEIGKLS